ncbi:hypothetical protein [Streptomyces sp. NPDC090056]|uniref:hypothetical protein n=2 Tax=Streptomyces TaxID=1883 RepID=UPI0006E44CB7|nr:hypothetical protein SSPNP10_19070 [Streptomyces sp. NP10]
MNTDVCGSTRHVPLEGYSGRARTWQKASWSRVLRETAVGCLIMLVPTLLLGFFMSWDIGIALVMATASSAVLSSFVFSLRGHTLGCAVKKGIVLTLGWWERI